MTFLQRDKEGYLRPIGSVTIDRRLYDELCDLLGNQSVGNLIEGLIVRFLEKRTPKPQVNYVNMYARKAEMEGRIHSEPEKAQTQDRKILEDIRTCIQIVQKD